MKLKYKDIIGRHSDIPAVIACHGPSLNDHRDKIEELQRHKKIIRFSMNEWYDFFSENPDYWVLSNTEYTIGASMHPTALWKNRGYPLDVFNKYRIPVLYNNTADLTDRDLIKENLKCDYFPYDTKHFKNHTCLEILKNFKKHYEQNKNLEYDFYGKNKQMWQKPNVKDFPPWFQRIHGKIAGGWSSEGKCCGSIGDITLQEKLQQITLHEQHIGTGQTVGMFAIMFAVIMKCNPIYIVGMDLDYSLGYAKAHSFKEYLIPNIGNVGHWKTTYRDFLLDDMRILRESAEKIGIKIINLDTKSWHNVFDKGNLNI
tara:strand:+ start:6154 stop:7095 length:942 start_codon:yes stop_codon:yes gene_type:complete